MTLNVPIALILGILIGWIIEFALDKLFWQRSNQTAKHATELEQKATRLEKERSDLWVRLTESEQNRSVAKEQLEISKQNLADAKAEIEVLSERIAELETKVESTKGKTISNETTTKVIRAAKKRILTLEAELKKLKGQQSAPVAKKAKQKSAVRN